MADAMRTLPDAELEVMQAIWACEEPVKRAAISAILDRTHPMAPTTLLTVLSRLADKGFVQIEKTGRFMMVKKAKDAGQILRFASMWNMEGIVVIGFCAQDYQTLRNHMRIPFVVYDGICGQTERIVNLSIDNSGGGEQVGRHFRALGHTRALCLSDNETGIDRDRIEGFFRGFAQGILFIRHKIENS